MTDATERDALAREVLAYADAEGLSRFGAIRAAVRMTAERENGYEKREPDEFAPGECTGAHDCDAPKHIHGCYRPHRADQCDAPEEYGHIEREPVVSDEAVNDARRVLARADGWSRPHFPSEASEHLDAVSTALARILAVLTPDRQGWAHCTPDLLRSGIDCGTTPRRPCACHPANGGHDHITPDGQETEPVVVDDETKWDYAALVTEAEQVYEGAVRHDVVDYDVGLIQRLGLALHEAAALTPDGQEKNDDH